MARKSKKSSPKKPSNLMWFTALYPAELHGEVRRVQKELGIKNANELLHVMAKSFVATKRAA